MNDKQIGGDHYAKHKIQPWDIIDEYGLNYYEGNIIKYVLRHRDKNGLQDLQKASHYLEKLIADMDEPRLAFPASRIHTLPNGVEIDLDDGWIPFDHEKIPYDMLSISSYIIRDGSTGSDMARKWSLKGDAITERDILAYKVV